MNLETKLTRLKQIVTVARQPERRRAALTKRALAALRAIERRIVEMPSGDAIGRDRALRARKMLNFGCGYDKREGHVNVDVDPHCQPDVSITRADLSRFPTAHYERVVAKDVLEHVVRAECLDLLLAFNEWLTPQGTLFVQTTSILGVADRIRRYPGFEDELGMTVCLFGSQMHPGDFHYGGFTELTLSTYLRAAGFEPGAYSLVDEWMFAVDAKKTLAWSQLAEQTLDERAFITAAYDQGLGRSASKEEVVNASHVLASGQTRKQFLRTLFGSAERLRYCARA